MILLHHQRKPPHAPASARLRAFLRAHREAWLLLYWIPYLIWFGLLELVELPQHGISCALDAYIPFNVWFAIPYFSWFAALFLSLAYYLLRDRETFENLCFLMFSGMTAALVVYTFWPMSIDVRVTLEGGGPLYGAVRALQGFDSPRNVCPSIHVSSSLAIAVAVSMGPALPGGRKAKAAVWVWMALICASTVLIKQHSLIDVFWGAVVTAVLSVVTYRLDWRAALRRTPLRAFL